MTVLYIDVSHYDWDRNKGNLDWQQIHSNGIDVAFIRASYGDPEIYSPLTRFFREMATEAKKAGIRVGGYHNLIHGDFLSTKRQVQYFRTELDAVSADYAMVDIEPYQALRDNGLYPRLSDAIAFATEFSRVDKQRNLTVYLAQWVWSSWLEKADLTELIELAGGPLINANYPLGTEKGAPYALYQKAGTKGWAPYGNRVPDIWQYSSNAQVPGASSTTDVNAFRGSVFELDRKLRKEVAN